MAAICSGVCSGAAAAGGAFMARLPVPRHAEMGDMSDVVAGVPGVQQSRKLDGLRSAFRVNEGAPPLLGLERLQK